MRNWHRRGRILAEGPRHGSIRRDVDADLLDVDAVVGRLDRDYVSLVVCRREHEQVAGLAGVARVASDIGGLPEIIENGVTGLLVPRDSPHVLALALTTCVENKDLRDKLGNQAKIDLEQFTDMKKMHQKIYRVYGE